MNELKVFENAEFGSIRTVIVGEEPYFVGKDVAVALGYSNASKAVLTHVDSEDKSFVMLDIADSQNGNVPVGQSKTAVINESGLYSLILSSKLPNAKRFKHWVTSEVLPSIRKHGAYMIPEKLEEMLLNPDGMIKILTALKQEQEKNKVLSIENKGMKPKALFADAVAASDTSILIGDLAKILKQNGYDTGQKRLFNTLREEGYLIKSGNSKNMPTQKSMDMGLFEVKERTINNPDGSVKITKTTKVTGRGQQYFVNKFIRTSA